MEVGVMNWYLLQAKPQQHEKALRNLENQEYECFSPTVSLSRIRNGKRATVTERLFPGYIFIKLGRDGNWLSVSSTRGVAKLVRFGLYPTVVPVNVVDNIKLNLDRFSLSLREERGFKSGDIVRISENGFNEFEGIYKCTIGNNRSVILIKYLQRIHEITVKTGNLERVG